MFGKKQRTQAELLAGMEERIHLLFGEFEAGRLAPFQRTLLENLNEALIRQMDDGGIDPETFRNIFVAECKAPWEIQLPLLEDEFLQTGDMPQWTDVSLTLGQHDNYGQWFNAQYDRLTHQLLFNATKVVGDLVLRDGVSPDDSEWN